MHEDYSRLLLCAGLLVVSGQPFDFSQPATAAPLRFATYNASLNRSAQDRLIRDLSTPGNRQARLVAEIIQRVRPDVLLLNEFDFDAAGTAAELLQQHYLAVAQDMAATGTAALPITYP